MPPVRACFTALSLTFRQQLMLLSLTTPIVLNVTVGLDGVVDVVTVVSGDPAFTPAALAAVREWQYQPLVISGRNTSFQTRVTFNLKPPGN